MIGTDTASPCRASLDTSSRPSKWLKEVKDYGLSANDGALVIEQQPGAR